MDYGNADICTECGEKLFLIQDPSQTMLEACSGYEMFTDVVLRLTDEKINLKEVAIGFCERCDVNAIIGPRVSISGTIIDDVQA